MNLTGAQKAHLRGLGQRLDPKVKIGKAGLTPGILGHLREALRANELVKVRFLDADRDERAALCVTIADQATCRCVGAVGHTALFYSEPVDPMAPKVALQ